MHAFPGERVKVRQVSDDKVGSVREDVIKAIHTHYGKEPKLKVKFAIATRNIEWRSADRARAEEAGIAIITDADLAYFKRLTDFLRTAARYQFLGRYFKGEKVEGLRAKVPATKGRMGDRVFYSLLMSPHDLLRLSYISHRSRTSNDDLDTYQRMVKPSRLKSIGRYIDNGGKFPTNIVINFKPRGRLNFEVTATFGDTATGTLSLPGQYGSAWVIDGQHRLYGYAYSSRLGENDRSVIPVLADENLPTRDKIQLFVDINTQQVKVTRNLVNEILSNLNIDDPDPKKRLDALYARIALRLDEYPGSPLRDRVLTVSQDKSQYRCLTLTSIANGLQEHNLLGTIHRSGTVLPGPLADVSADPQLTLEKAVATLSGYFNLFFSRLDTHWKLDDAKGGYLCTNLGLRALLMLLRKLINFVENREGLRAAIMDSDEIIRYVAPYTEPIIEFFSHADANDVSAFRSRGSSLLSVSENCRHMMSAIYEKRPSFNPPEVIDYVNNLDVEGTRQAQDMIHSINRILFENVVSSLKDKYGTANDAWWLQGIPKAVRNSCDQMYNETHGELERWRYLFLSNYPDIIVYSDNWDLFKEYYDFYGRGKKVERIRWIGHINKARTATHHPEKGPLSKQEVDYVRRIYQLVKVHIEGRQKVDPGKRYIDDRHEQEAVLAAVG